MSQIAFGYARAVLEADTNSFRFEQFANATVADLEQLAIVSTAASWDQARDGRSVGTSRRILLCASLRDDVDAKALADIRTVLKSATPATIYFCSSQSLSEHSLDRLKAVLRRDVPIPDDIEVEVLSAHQLADRALVSSEPFERHYGAEYRSIIESLGEEGRDSGANDRLRLALSTLGQADSDGIRNEIFRSSILMTLKDATSPATINTLCKTIADKFRLGAPLSSLAAGAHIRSLRDDGLLLETPKGYSLTAQGVAYAAQKESEAAGSLVAGRQHVREQIEGEIGGRISEDQFSLLWAAMLDKVSHLFFERGLELVQAVRSLIQQQSRTADDAPSPVEKIALELAACARAATANVEQREELEVAIKDIFARAEGHAYDWLLETCASYVAICTMALDPAVSDQVKHVLRSMSFVLDTDVVISLIAEAEPDHEAVSDVHEHCLREGVKLLVGESTMQEVAHHAWIAHEAYRHERRAARGGTLRQSQNAFVRAFFSQVDERTKGIDSWKGYIKDYCGAASNDTSVIEPLLLQDYRLERLPNGPIETDTLQRQIAEFLCERIREREPSGHRRDIRTDKANRDAVLATAVSAHRKALTRTGARADCFIVSSAMVFAIIGDEFRQHFCAVPLRLSMAELTYILTLLPGGKLGLRALKGLLFDQAFRTKMMKPKFRELLQIIENTEFEIPSAKRFRLERKLSSRLVAKAQDGGSGVAEVVVRLSDPSNSEEAASLILGSIQDLAVDSKLEREVTTLRVETDRLNRENQELKRQLRSAGTSPPIEGGPETDSLQIPQRSGTGAKAGQRRGRKKRKGGGRKR